MIEESFGINLGSDSKGETAKFLPAARTNSEKRKSSSLEPKRNPWP